jgi:hypothetical protein
MPLESECQRRDRPARVAQGRRVSGRLAVALVRSLFCGLVPRRRMAVFVSQSDETSGADGQVHLNAGWLATEDDWSNWFTGRWQSQVLDAEVKIESFHATDLMNPRWQREHGLTDGMARRKLGSALRICQPRKFAPMVAGVRGEDFKEFQRLIKRGSSPLPRILRTPYTLCFIAYVRAVLHFAKERASDVERVDFVVERNGKLTRYVEECRNYIEPYLAAEDPEMAPLLGDFFPAGKDRLPVQSADLLCWILQRKHATNRSKIDAKRSRALLSRPGMIHRWKPDELSKLAVALNRRRDAARG